MDAIDYDAFAMILHAWHPEIIDRVGIELGREEGDSHYTLVKRGYSRVIRLCMWRKGQTPREFSLGDVVHTFTEAQLWHICFTHGSWEEMYTDNEVTPEELALVGHMLGDAWCRADRQGMGKRARANK